MDQDINSIFKAEKNMFLIHLNLLLKVHTFYRESIIFIVASNVCVPDYSEEVYDNGNYSSWYILYIELYKAKKKKNTHFHRPFAPHNSCARKWGIIIDILYQEVENQSG